MSERAVVSRVPLSEAAGPLTLERQPREGYLDTNGARALAERIAQEQKRRQLEAELKGLPPSVDSSPASAASVGGSAPADADAA